ncbi:MAG TPA: ATP-binding protein [Verrucomicrobiae bacterium]|nr:ATP-binding protein [Verrucomicrobiae bacterium]
MDISRRSTLIYGLLLAAWVLVLGWQTAEHFRVRRAARAQLIYRAQDISNTLGIVLRSQRRFGVLSKERLESALNDLVRPGELHGIALLNAAGDVVASAGTLGDFQARNVDGPAERWNQQTVTLMNLVDLGTNVTRDIENSRPPIVLPRDQFFHPSETNRFAEGREEHEGRPPEPPPPPPSEEESNRAAMATNEPAESASSTNRPWFRGGQGRPRFGRPPWMSEEVYNAMLQKQGVRSFVIVMSTTPVVAASMQDLWLRCIIGLLATVSVVGSGLAWRNLTKSSDLQLRLVRASELTTHLKEMNLAAAGLAHETRNPLNIIRGLAQMISKQTDTPAEIREKSRAIVDEADKVTVQLNEFINYSRPREVRRTPLTLSAVVNEVVHTLGYDIEEKRVQVEIKGESLSIEADEQLLRQALFNLLLNAVQAVDAGGGVIQIVMAHQNASEATLEIRDNGSGVPMEQRKEIFKPYFTTHPKGTGLGLTVVQQIVHAHGWEIECLPNEPKGAIFRVAHLKLTGKN